MSTTQKTKKLYNKYAKKYDKQNAMMEVLISKGRKIFNLLKGEVLEVGVGTGNNLSYYNPEAKITALDFSPEMIHQTNLKIMAFNLKNIKQVMEGDVQNLNKYFKSAKFDYVTSTCVFCSVPNPIKGLQQISNVLRPSGKLIQIEHGLSNFKFINIFLKFLDPLTSNLRGFHLSRNITENLRKSGFRIIKSINLDPFGIIKVIISQPSKIKIK